MKLERESEYAAVTYTRWTTVMGWCVDSWIVDLHAVMRIRV